MMRRTLFAALLVAALVTGLIAPTAYAQDGEWTVVAEGLNGPMGVLVDPDGNVWVIDSGLGGDQEIDGIDPNSGQEIAATYGDSAQVVQIAPDGTQTAVASLPSLFLGSDTAGGERQSRRNNS
jgi:DNA-binding beta-propeller fold protein YncE